MSIMYLAVLMLCRELNYEPLDNEPTPITTRPDLFIMSFSNWTKSISNAEKRSSFEIHFYD